MKIGNLEWILVDAMEACGKRYEIYDSEPHYLIFVSEDGLVEYFDDWEEVYAWLLDYGEMYCDSLDDYDEIMELIETEMEKKMRMEDQNNVKA